MAKTDKERQAARRKKLKENKELYLNYLHKDRIRKAEERKRKRERMTPQEVEEHKFKERMRIREYRAKKRSSLNETSSATLPVSFPYGSKQAAGKAFCKLSRALPSSLNKQRYLIAKAAELVGINLPKKSQKSHRGLSANTIANVRKFYNKNEISWQAPGRKDRIIIREKNSHGKTTQKYTQQLRYMTMSLKEAHQLYMKEVEDDSEKVGLSKFCELRPQNIKTFDKMPHNVCVCVYHENVRLLLMVLSQYTGLKTDFGEFVEQVTCDPNNKSCNDRSCLVCKNFLSEYEPNQVEEYNVPYYQWQAQDKRMEKVLLQSSPKHIFEELNHQLKNFLVHRYVKKQQSKKFESLVASCTSEKVVLQLDFSENASLIDQNEIQSAHWNHNEVTLFTGHAWINSECKKSFVIISNDLNHTKEAVYAFVSYILEYLNKNYANLKIVNIWSDGAASQFKQRYLFANLHPWQEQFSIKIFWHFFATSHGKGVVDGIGGTVKRSVWRHIKSANISVDDAEAYSKVASKQNPNVHIKFISKEKVNSAVKTIADRWKSALVVPNTQKLHFVKVEDQHYISVAHTSDEEQYSVAIASIVPKTYEKVVQSENQ